MSCWWVAQLLPRWSPPAPMARRMQEQDKERWCLHTYERVPSSSTGTYGGMLPEEQMKKQVRFNVDEDFGNDSTLPMDLTTFLVGGTATEWDNTLSPSIPLSVDPPQPPHSKGHQCHPTNTGRGSPKGPHQTLCCSIPISATTQRDARPSEPPLLMDPGRDGKGRNPPSLLEGNKAIKSTP